MEDVSTIKKWFPNSSLEPSNDVFEVENLSQGFLKGEEMWKHVGIGREKDPAWCE